MGYVVYEVLELVLFVGDVVWVVEGWLLYDVLG